MISKDQFLYIRDLARFENLKVNLLKKEFIRSLYESYLLQQTYPNNEFVKDVQAKSIYGIAKVMNSIDEDILEESITKELSVSEYYNLYGLHYYNLEDKEQLALAISYLAHQNDSDYNKYIEDLIVDLKTEHEVVYSDFKWAIDKDKKKEEKEEVDESKLSKVEKLEKLSSESVEKENSIMVAALAASTKNKDVLDLFIDVQDRKIDKESKSNKKSNLTSAAEKKERRKTADTTL